MIFRSLTIGGNGASAIATVSGGVVRQIIPLTNGSNYFSPPAITLVGNGTGATAQANIIQGQVGTIKVTNGGSGYTYPPTVNIISSSGDWNFGQGLSSYFTGNAAIAANIKTALNTFLGDAFWQANFGVDWINLLGNKNTEQSIISQTRAIIANCYGVVQINSINYNLDSLRRQLTLSYTISTIYSSNVTSSSTVSY
jgi:hypothetical protein